MRVSALVIAREPFNIKGEIIWQEQKLAAN